MNHEARLLARLIFILVLPGCLAPGSTPDGAAGAADDAPTNPSALGANQTGESETGSANGSAVLQDFGVVGNQTVTRSENLTYSVATRGPVTVTLRFNGSLLDSRVVDGSHGWNLTLPFGRRNLSVSFEAPGLFQHHNLTLTRLGLTRLRIDYGPYHPSYPGAPWKEQHEIWIDIDDRPSAAQYAAVNAKHKDAFVAHDQLVLYEGLTGKKVEYRWYPSFQQFAVDRIDGAGNPVSSSAPPWWCYKLNGRFADGISIQVVRPGDLVEWNLGTCT